MIRKLYCVFLLVCITLIKGFSSDHESYLVVFRNASIIANGSRASYSQKMIQELDAKLNQLMLNTGLRNSFSNIDKLWISQSIRIDLTPAELQQIASDPLVMQIVPDETILLELPQPGKVNPSADKFTYGLESLEVPQVWEKYKLRGEGVTVGVIDTGWADHIDIRGKVIRSKDFISKFAENVPNDDQGHGTHCIGTIGGGSESGKAIGVAPAVQFVVAKIFDAYGRATRSGILKAMQWMTDPDGNPDTDDFPRVVSNSWGKKYEGFENETQYRRATAVWRDFEIAPVFAAGNSGPNSNTIASPGALQSTLAVAAINQKDLIASFSSRGAVDWQNGTILQKPDVAAPGVDVYSAAYKGGYVSWNGTSMACPHVAGVIALMLQANNALSVEQIFSILKQSAYELGDAGWDEAYGYGKISALRAVEIARDLSTLSLDINAQAKLIRVTNSNTGQVYRFNSGQTSQLFLKSGTYQFDVESFGSLTKQIEVQLTKGQLVSLSLTLQKAPSVQWSIKVIDDKNRPVQAQMVLADVPVEIQQIGKDGIQLELPTAIYNYVLTAYGYIKLQGRIKLDSDQKSVLRMVSLKDVLIVNSTRDEILTRYVTSSVPRSYKYDYTNKYRNITLEEMQKYKRVLWFTGDEKTRALPYIKREILQNYSDWGGTVILTGQNIRENLESSDFTEELFGIKVTRPKSAQTRLKGLGLGFRLNDGSSAKNQDSPEEISTTTDETEILLSWMNNQGALSERINGRGRAYYLGFGIEGLSANDRTRLLEILFERSSNTLLDELQYAARVQDESLKKQIIDFASTLKASSKNEAIKVMQLLQSMQLNDSGLFKNLTSQINFQTLHESK